MAKPGRKPKYITEEERQLAKREQINRAVRKYRAKKKVIFVKPVAARLTSADPAEAITSIPTSSPPNIENALHHFRASSIQLIDLRDDDLITNNLVEDFLRDSPEWWWPWRDGFKYNQHDRTYTEQFLARAHLATIATNIAQVKCDKGLERLAEVNYQSALGTLRRCLSTSQINKYAVPFVSAICCLLAYQIMEEILTQSREFQWIWHMKGILSILQQVDAASFCSGMGVTMLRGLVSRLMWVAVRERDTLVFELDDWQKSLRPLDDDANHLHKVWRLAVQVPGLYGHLKQILTAKTPQDSKLFSIRLLKSRANVLSRALDDWLDEFKQSVGTENVLYWYTTRASHTTWNFEQSPFNFYSLDAAKIMMVYWTYKLEVAHVAEKMQECISILQRSSPADSMSPPDLDGIDATQIQSQSITRLSPPAPHKVNTAPEGSPSSSAAHYAYNILYSLEYWMTAIAADGDPLCTCFSLALRVAHRWFVEADPARDLFEAEIDYCADMSVVMRRRDVHGMLAEHILDGAFGAVKRAHELESLVRSRGGKRRWVPLRSNRSNKKDGIGMESVD